MASTESMGHPDTRRSRVFRFCTAPNRSKRTRSTLGSLLLPTRTSCGQTRNGLGPVASQTSTLSTPAGMGVPLAANVEVVGFHRNSWSPTLLKTAQAVPPSSQSIDIGPRKVRAGSPRPLAGGGDQPAIGANLHGHGFAVERDGSAVGNRCHGRHIQQAHLRIDGQRFGVVTFALATEVSGARTPEGLHVDRHRRIAGAES